MMMHGLAKVKHPKTFVPIHKIQTLQTTILPPSLYSALKMESK